MALPVPNLDDRRFQDLVDDAKRLVQQRCPEWSDHNVSDPGVTLIEAFAFMTDQLLYRLNRVPDRHYVKFLELIGVKLFPPVAAHAPLTFYLSAPQPGPVRIAAGTQAATVRTEADEAIVFTTLEDLAIVPCSFGWVAAATSDGTVEDRTEILARGGSFEAFDPVPQPGNALLIGLSDPVPSCAVALTMRCTIEGVGVDPTRPPIVWEAWAGESWLPCDVETDGTGGLNKDGQVIVHVPAGHTASVIEKRRAGWIRVRVVEPDADVPAYSASPRIHGIAACTIGGTAGAAHARVIGAAASDGGVPGEMLGSSRGVPGQTFRVLHPPIVPSDRPATLWVSEGDRWEEWQEVKDFAGSGPADRHFMVDAVAGSVILGPGVRQRDGSFRQYGRVPPNGARLRIGIYLNGGGKAGNVAAGALSVMKTTIPFVARVANRKPGLGGVDGEDIENAKLRGPISLRTRSRAVTAEDYEQIVAEAAPEIARVKAVPVGGPADDLAVRVLVVPRAPDEEGRLRFEQLQPADETLKRIAAELDRCRVIGARVSIEPPAYRGITVVTKIQPRPGVNPSRLQAEATRALYLYFHPIAGGPGGSGWPFGRPVQVGEVYAVLQALPGTELVEDVRLFGADPITGRRAPVTQRIDLGPNELVFSYEHQLMVEGAE